MRIKPSSSSAWLLSAAFPVAVLVLSIILNPLGTPATATASNNNSQDDNIITPRIRTHDARAQSVLQAVLAFDPSQSAPNPFRYRPGEIYDASNITTSARPTRTPKQQFVVTSILGGNNPIALINSKAYRQTDAISDGWSIKTIDTANQSVTLTHTDGSERTITLHMHRTSNK